jgi:hypothetical protein
MYYHHWLKFGCRQPLVLLSALAHSFENIGKKTLTTSTTTTPPLLNMFCNYRSALGYAWAGPQASVDGEPAHCAAFVLFVDAVQQLCAHTPSQFEFDER